MSILLNFDFSGTVMDKQGRGQGALDDPKRNAKLACQNNTKDIVIVTATDQHSTHIS